MSRRRDEEVDQELVGELKDAFDMFDSSKKGYLDKDDVKKLFKTNGIRVTDEDLDAAFKEADADGDKKIECMEFINMMTGKMKTASTEQKLTEAFKVFDPEEKGVIDSKELTEALLNIGERCTTSEVGELKTVAENQEGQIRYELFIQAVFAKK
ncbi:calmodulin, putative [Entamoeba histolytica HM-1:IMSS-B]|uniref:Calmodulin, putative n=9 Tax=Entamoeba TaxID=5758 RepID=C4LUQ9_ENTH1|nr:myosin regulatory light chain, putative [Entamoeba dispar SAW760]XP_008860522.1 calmodulin, putative [Entamoeba nuttalli P19]XP_655621.1 calmodulin, putative [Entamoeba histolytica HM-1:IMSS]EMD46570.1 myosin regulatory light chain, putative [Entamoeba histolytica KU27]EMH72560.1 calmodulin, putative [Entamoeba histolytica HM-1:IMSS-B]EMS13658.1 myosin regulatory light chain [Entamoeba histolytica HM-3:IMSS]ENY63446.1 myosin regulatory light chain, putative [Entamoeba histolytica HM-1:IMSS|eukprot:EDR26180.1 myosin regulatory light chain, putative [Entamoeba dispar SAW760]